MLRSRNRNRRNRNFLPSRNRNRNKMESQKMRWKVSRQQWQIIQHLCTVQSAAQTPHLYFLVRLLTRPFLYISGRDLIPEEETLTPEMMFNTLAPAGLLVMGARTFLSPGHFLLVFFSQCSGSVTLWYGSADPDPCFSVVSRCQNKLFFLLISVPVLNVWYKHIQQSSEIKVTV